MIDGNGSGIGQLQIGATLTNAGLIEGTTSEGVTVGGGSAPIMNSGTIAALGNNAFAEIFNVSVTDATAKALILASGSGAQMGLNTVTVNGGTLKTSGGGQITAFNGDATLSNVTIAASSFLVNIGGFDDILTLNGGTIGAAAVVETSGGTAIVSGTVSNGGTLFASAAGDLIEIASGAVVNGGVALIGNGIVEIAGSSGENVKFLSNGNGGLQIADTSGHTSAFSGRVSGFGGSDHSNQTQFIDLISVTSAANTISLSYVSAASHTSGTLFVSSGGAVVAAINMVGAYTSANFSARADGHGNVRSSIRQSPTAAASTRAGRHLPAARHRSAGHRLRRADDACLFTQRHRHRRHPDGERWPPRGGDRAPRQLHGRKPFAPTAMAARWFRRANTTAPC